MSAAASLAEAMAHDGYAFRRAGDTASLLAEHGFTDAAWQAFAGSWDDLGVDTYMADGGRYRKRRHAVFAAGPDGIGRRPHQPHYQSRDYNPVNGGIERWFDPVTEAAAANPAFAAILRACRAVFERVAPEGEGNWLIETHQFRIEARAGQQGRPTPEGLHRDGVDYVLVLLVARDNIASGITSIHAADRTPLGSFTLEHPLDAAWVDDHRVFHGVTPVEPLEPARPAHRDVLVVTFRRELGV